MILEYRMASSRGTYWGDWVTEPDPTPYIVSVFEADPEVVSLKVTYEDGAQLEYRRH